MRRPTLLAFGLSIVVAVAACDNQGISAPQAGGNDELAPVPSLPTASANLNCRYTPSGDISIPLGQVQTFVPVNVADCAGAYGVLTMFPTTAYRVGFYPNNINCTVRETFEAGSANLFKVKRCLTGAAGFNIYTSSSKTTLLQHIGIDVNP